MMALRWHHALESSRSQLEEQEGQQQLGASVGEPESLLTIEEPHLGSPCTRHRKACLDALLLPVTSGFSLKLSSPSEAGSTCRPSSRVGRAVSGRAKSIQHILSTPLRWNEKKEQLGAPRCGDWRLSGFRCSGDP